MNVQTNLAQAVREYGTQKAAAEALGMPLSTFHSALKREQRIEVPSSDLKSEVSELKALVAALIAKSGNGEAIQPVAPKMDVKPKVRVQAGSSRLLSGLAAAQPSGPESPIVRPVFGYHSAREANVLMPVSEEIRRVLFIGDVHGHPSIEAESARCLALAAEHARSMRPDAVVLGGDFMDWASVCHHEKNATWRGRRKPTISQDIECCEALLDVLATGLDAAGVKQRIFTWGNHEDWLHQFENEHPEVHGEYTSSVKDMFSRRGFKSFPYGEYVTLGGVDFTHVPKNKMDRPVGGQTAENTVAQQATRDTIFCHTHVHAMGKRAKFGFRNAVTVLNGGSCMPTDYVGDYAQRTTGSFTDSGVMEVDIADGRIVGHAWVSMRRLESLYAGRA